MTIAGIAAGLVLVAAAAATTQGKTARSKDGVPLQYEVSGKGEPTVVLVHGWAVDRRIWDDQVAVLAKRYRVAALDLAGHGQSGRQRDTWTVAAFGQDVQAVVEAIGAKQVVLVGHSMSGPVTLEATLRMPEKVKGIVVVDTLLDVDQVMPSELIEQLTQRLQADYAGSITPMANDFLFAPGTPAPVRERVLRYVTAMPAATSIAILRQSWAYDSRPALQQIKVPIRAVNADKFPTNLEADRKYMPGFQALFVPGSGHYPMLEDPKRFTPALEQAIQDVLGAKR